MNTQTIAERKVPLPARLTTHKTQRRGSNLQTKQGFGRIRIGAALAASMGLWMALSSTAEASDAFIPHLVNTSTVPANGDVNPYGVAFVPDGFPGGGAIAAGDVLVSNFNSSAN